MSDQPACACDLFVHPKIIRNLPGLDAISYRPGDFSSFRRALLLARPGETELAAWRPGGTGDLAVQLVDWWAVLSDILTFYNERAIQEAFLRTADLPASVTDLVRLLGYRPRPGIGAVGTVAALVSGKKPIVIAKGLAIQSKPGPGKEPQVFEVDADTTAGLPDSVDVDPSPDPKLFGTDEGKSTLLLAGSVTVKAGDRLLLRRRNWTGLQADALLVTVAESKKETSPRGVKNTRVVLSANHGRPAELAANWLLLRPTQSAALFSTASKPIEDIREADHFDAGGTVSAANNASALARSAIEAPSFAFPDFSFLGGTVGLLADLFADTSAVDNGARIGPQDRGTSPNVPTRTRSTGHSVHLEAVRTPIDPGDALLLERPELTTVVAFVRAHGREIWYLNGLAASPEKPPTGDKVVPIAVLHSKIRIPSVFNNTSLDDWNAHADEVKVSYGWVEVGTIIGTPAAQFAVSAATAVLLAAEPDAAKLAGQQNVFLADANGVGTAGRITTATAKTVGLEELDPLATPLVAPLELLTNLVAVSRGKTVASEVLGSGDATVDGQEMVLKKSPVTYLGSGDGYRSTLRVFVDGIEWMEVPSFYGQAGDAKVFVTKEDAEQKTHVLFGDGTSGARLSTGTGNVVATYRYGSGAEVPEPGTLTVILKPQPGLRSIRNPIAPFGGSDPDAPEKIRTYAPRSVLTFGRAVSADDYEVIAASAPGVSRASASWTFDARQQRALVTVHVGDDEGAVASARLAIAGSADPNRPLDIVLAQPVDCSLALTLVVSPDRIEETVVAAVRAALEDPDRGLFGKNAIRIGQVIFNSHIHAACLAVDGTLAVHSLVFRRGSAVETGPRHHPGVGRFFRLTALTIDGEQG